MLGEANMKMITSAASTVMPWLISNFLYEATPIHNALKMLVDKLLADETIKGIFDAVAEVMEKLKGIGAFSLFTDALEQAWNSIKSKLTGADLPSEEVTNEVEKEHENALSALTFTKADLIEEELATECPTGYEPLADSDECVAAMRLLYPPDLTLAESERKPWNQAGLSKAEKIAVISERNVPLGCLKKWDMVKREYTLEYNREEEDDVAAGRHLQKVNLICVKV
ncbi:unnamed protein product [Amoebophrya sp. A120]|nr:unnamed protein product [Amoebophrya sp. A120]|eukprot:GSA120T00026110001.1